MNYYVLACIIFVLQSYTYTMQRNPSNQSEQEPLRPGLRVITHGLGGVGTNGADIRYPGAQQTRE